MDLSIEQRGIAQELVPGGIQGAALLLDGELHVLQGIDSSTLGEFDVT